MNFKTKTLEGEKLILRKFQREDLKSIYTWARDEEVSRYLSWKSPNSLEELEVKLEEILASYEENSQIHWALVERSKDKVIGSIKIYPFSEDTLGLEFSTNKEYRYIEEGIKNSIEYIKREFPKIKYIRANILAVNVPYIKVVKALGFTFKNTKIMSMGKLKDRYTFIYEKELV